MVAGVHPVGIHGAEVLDVKLDERPGELHAETDLLGKGVGLELESAGDNVQEQLNDGVQRRERVGEEQETDNDGLLGGEAKGRVQRVVVDEDREQAEDIENVCLG